MKQLFLIVKALLVCFLICEVNAVKLPGPLVYVVTPSPRPPQIDKARSAPFYYHNWMRRMDTPHNASTSTTTTTSNPKTPDLIFAEFESGNNMKSIRKLLERERIEPKTTSTTTLQPIYVPDDPEEVTRVVNYGLPVVTESNEEKSSSESDDYFSMYNQLYNKLPVPVYSPSTKATTIVSTQSTTTSTTTPTTTNNVENIWHIIDNEKYNQYSGNWEEQSLSADDSETTRTDNNPKEDEPNFIDDKINKDQEPIDENFALPGFGTTPGNGGENESRAIRTETNMHFPYVNLKPFLMKTSKKPSLNTFSNSKKNNMFTSLDNFHDIKNPVRGEAQDVVSSIRQPIDRYNPAQPYLPQPDYGGNSKQSSGNVGSIKTVANLVPPPPPPPPKITGNDFPSPTSYESFPPYSPPVSIPAPAPPVPPTMSALPAPPVSKPIVSMYQPPIIDSMDDSDSDSPPGDSDGPQSDLGYQYKQHSPQFLPTLPPLKKPFEGYSYNKPTVTLDSLPPMDSGDKPDFHGYHYSKPAPAPPPVDNSPPSYGHHTAYHHDNDYPELVYDKHHDGPSNTKGDDMKGTDMMPPPPPPDMTHDHGPPMDSGPPTDDHGFPHDFPGDLKFHHDFDEHDYHHHHHPTTTTTTEQPRVNRYSYYYLGKKLYYLPLYFSVYFIIYVGALIIKAVLRHKIVYPNSWRPNDTTSSFFSKRSVDSWNLSKENLHEITGRVTHAIATAAEKYINEKK